MLTDEQSRREASQQSKRTKTLEGDLSSLPLGDLLEYLEQARKTGRLEVRSAAGLAAVEISRGIPTRARNGALAGEEAIASLVHLTRGYFHFEEDAGVSEPSGAEPLPSIMAVKLREAVRQDHASRPQLSSEPLSKSPAESNRSRRPIPLFVRWSLAALAGVALAVWLVRPSRPHQEAARITVVPRSLEAAQPAIEEPGPAAANAILKAQPSVAKDEPTLPPTPGGGRARASGPEAASDLVRPTVSDISPDLPVVGQTELAPTLEEPDAAPPEDETVGQSAAADRPSPEGPPRASIPAQRPREPSIPELGEPSTPQLLIPEVWVGEIVAAGPGVERPRLKAPLQPFLSGAGRRMLRESGMRLRLFVAHTGAVMDTELLDPGRLSPRDERRVLKAAENAEFRPATKQGVPVNMWTEVTVRDE